MPKQVGVCTSYAGKISAKRGLGVGLYYVTAVYVLHILRYHNYSASMLYLFSLRLKFIYHHLDQTYGTVPWPWQMRSHWKVLFMVLYTFCPLHQRDTVSWVEMDHRQKEQSKEVSKEQPLEVGLFRSIVIVYVHSTRPVKQKAYRFLICGRGHIYCNNSRLQ